MTNAGLAKLQALPKLELLDVRVHRHQSTVRVWKRCARPGTGRKVVFVNNAPAATVARGNERPKSARQEAIAQWIKSLGGGCADYER